MGVGHQEREQQEQQEQRLATMVELKAVLQEQKRRSRRAAGVERQRQQPSTAVVVAGRAGAAGAVSRVAVPPSELNPRRTEARETNSFSSDTGGGEILTSHVVVKHLKTDEATGVAAVNELRLATKTVMGAAAAAAESEAGTSTPNVVDEELGRLLFEPQSDAEASDSQSDDGAARIDTGPSEFLKNEHPDLHRRNEGGKRRPAAHRRTVDAPVATRRGVRYGRKDESGTADQPQSSDDDSDDETRWRAAEAEGLGLHQPVGVIKSKFNKPRVGTVGARSAVRRRPAAQIRGTLGLLFVLPARLPACHFTT